MNNRVVLTAFALLVIGGLIALIVAIGAGGDSEPDSRRVATTDPGTAPATDRGTEPSRSRPAVDDAPELPDTPDVREPVVYMTDAGQLVRDHRSDPSKPAPLEKLPGPTKVDRKMQQTSVLSVRHALRPIVRRCQRELSADQLGDNPRLQAVLTVSVVGEELTVDDIDLQVADAPSEAIESCVRTGFAGWQGSVPGEPDIKGFKLTYPFRLNP